jgi:sugar lactone lactonase YvrE
MRLRRWLMVMLVMAVVAGVAVTPGSIARAGNNQRFPKIIPLPNGFQPEGIVIGRGTNLYAGSLATGAIYRADLRTGEGALLVPPQTGRIAVGLDYDRRTNYLFVSGGSLGTGYVYDAKTGESKAAYTFTSGSTFVNDAIVTRKAAYFTDSSRPVLYRVPLGAQGRLPDQSAITEVPLSGDFVFVPGAFNANGIEATPNGKWLIVVHSARGELYRVDPATGQATLIDLGGGSVPAGDGLLLQGHTLYVVQNQLNQIAVINLKDNFTRGRIEATLTDADFRVPTTIANYGNRLYLVNARFGTPPTPDTEYEVVQVRAHRDD